MQLPHPARKRFGQHFLVDQNCIDQIIAAIHPQIDDTIVEIGPGLGALTAPLLSKTRQLHLIELDQDLIPYLHHLPQPLAAPIIHQADALSVDLAQLSEPDSQLRIVGNLPYNISTPLLFHFMDYADRIIDIHVMLQKEVVDRICATPGGRDYGRLSVMLQYRCAISRLLEVPANAFKPPPKVDSAVIRLTPYQTLPYPVKDEKQLAALVKNAFAQRRKMLSNTLKSMLSAQQIQACGIDPKQRAEQSTVAEFVRLANAITDSD